MFTRKQHYYPRCLLKHFANENKMIYVHIRQANKKAFMNYEKVCVATDAYETEDKVDNILEHKLGVYESEIEKIIDYIIENIKSKGLDVSENMQNKIFQYIHLQYLRTDAGRINFMNLIENPFTYKPRKKPIDLDEIQKHKNTIKKFNEIFKQGNNLENLLKRMKKPSNMNFHIAISEDNLLTSDNPVIATDNWNQIMLPITPNILIEFQEDKINSSNDLRVILKKNKTRYVNEATINTANYFIISNKEFTRYQYKYIDNRFNNKNWEIGYPHVNLKN
ncbi:TPA: DUF4238 domain-containing protein [Staphylococcus aureus]|nr:DUF4238 domain-containing protein [Staphylococcus aureus]